MNSSETSTPVLRAENNLTKTGKLQLVERLDSWKEIALYLRRSVRCVQRWEKNEGMPVCRHSHANGMSVYAFRDELHAWLQTRQRRSPEIPGLAASSAMLEKSCLQNDSTEWNGFATPIAASLGERASSRIQAESARAARGVATILLLLKQFTSRTLPHVRSTWSQSK